MKPFILLALTFLSLHTCFSQKHYLVAGTYTGGKSEGLYVFQFNGEDGALHEVSHAKTSNPSFVALSPDQRFVFAVHENANNGDGGAISSYAFDKASGNLTLINQQATGGDHPCYVSVDKTGKWVFAGNYSSGSLSVLPVSNDGSLGAASTTIRHQGSSVNKERQEKPHVHCTFISPDNKFLYVPDLGIDKVMIYAFDARTGKLSPAPQPFVKARPGAGPRHISFHPNGRFAYLVEELTGQVVVYSYKNGRLTELQQTSTLPRGQQGFAGSADIHVSPDGKFLYASNRGDFNNIAIFKVNAVTGKLAIVGFQPTLGKVPRNFNFDPSGNFLLVANQESDEIVVFKRDKQTGLLTDSGNRATVGKPVCIAWVK